MNRTAVTAYLSAENRKYGEEFVDISRDEWPPAMLAATTPVLRVWRNARFLVQLFDEAGGRLTVNRTRLDPLSDRWAAGITWDELMAAKAGVGLGDRWAVELYPPDGAVVDVANMRHLWLIDAAPDFAW